MASRLLLVAVMSQGQQMLLLYVAGLLGGEEVEVEVPSDKIVKILLHFTGVLPNSAWFHGDEQ